MLCFDFFYYFIPLQQPKHKKLHCSWQAVNWMKLNRLQKQPQFFTKPFYDLFLHVKSI